MGRRLRFGRGSLRIEMDDTLSQMVRNAAEKVAPALLDAIEAATKKVYDDAAGDWPIKTGTSLAGLEHHVTISPDYGEARGSVTNDVEYAKFIKANKLGGKSVFVELLRKPMRKAAKDLIAKLPERTADLIVDGK